MIREDFLQQNAFVDTDAYTTFKKQYLLMKVIFTYQKMGKKALSEGASMESLFKIPARDKVGRAKDVLEENYESAYNDIISEIEAQIGDLIAAAGGESK